MHIIDICIFISYLLAMLGVGVYFMRQNKNTEDYYVGGRKLNSLHIGLSVVATDVGGGFSIGLGGLGFAMGLSGSWLLFTGLLGAWLSGVLLIPRVADLARRYNFLSFPQFLEHSYNKKVALFAGIISAIGYIGFTSSQILAGAKLATSTFPQFSMEQALYIMGGIAIIYTVLGGLKAVIYTDTVQWIILLLGLTFIALPFAYFKLGGIHAISEAVPEGFLSLRNIQFSTVFNWAFTIIPIWFIGMTLYQRIYASRNEKTAQKAWFIAGLFEYPIMAFVGVALGLLARVALEQSMLPGFSLATMDAEMSVPILLKNILPVGLLGIVLSAYFSAIMSTADSCLMAASGNILTDILGQHNNLKALRLSQIITLIVGLFALGIALRMTSVLELMLHSYSFMVSGMLIPVLMALFHRSPNAKGALAAILIGGGTALYLILTEAALPWGLEANIFGISTSLLSYIIVSKLSPKPLQL